MRVKRSLWLLSWIFPLVSAYGNYMPNTVIETFCGGIIGDRTESVEQPNLFGQLAHTLEGKRPGVGGVIDTTDLYFRPSFAGVTPSSDSLAMLNDVRARLRRAQENITRSVADGEQATERGELPHYFQIATNPDEFYWLVQGVGTNLTREEEMGKVGETKVQERFRKKKETQYMSASNVGVNWGLLGIVTGVITEAICFISGCDPIAALYASIPQPFLAGGVGFYLGRKSTKNRERSEEYHLELEEMKKEARQEVFYAKGSNHREMTSRGNIPQSMVNDWNVLTENTFNVARGRYYADRVRYYTFILESDQAKLIVVVRFASGILQIPQIAYFVEGGSFRMPSRGTGWESAGGE